MFILFIQGNKKNKLNLIPIRTVVLYSRVEDIDELLSVIVKLQQLENFVWIINERALITNSSALFDG